MKQNLALRAILACLLILLATGGIPALAGTVGEQNNTINTSAVISISINGTPEVSSNFEAMGAGPTYDDSVTITAFDVVYEYNSIKITGIAFNHDLSRTSSVLKVSDDDGNIVFVQDMELINSGTRFTFYLSNDMGGKNYHFWVWDLNGNARGATQIFLPQPPFFGEMKIEKTRLAPGESTNARVEVGASSVQSLAFFTSVPEGWTIEAIKSTASKYRLFDQSAEWIWFQVNPGTTEPGTIEYVIYKVTMPQNAVYGDQYFIAGSLINASGQSFYVTGDHWITVDILSYYRGLGNNPSVVETEDLLRAADDWVKNINPVISTLELMQLANEWSSTPASPPTPITPNPFPIETVVVPVPTATLVPNPLPTVTVVPELEPVSIEVTFSLSSDSPSGMMTLGAHQVVASFDVTNTRTTDVAVEKMAISYGGSAPILSTIGIYVDGVKIGEGSVGEGLATNLSSTTISPGQTVAFDVTADTTRAIPGQNLYVTLESATVRLGLDTSSGYGEMETTLPLNIQGGVLEY